ncbi:MAG: DNA repair protein RecO [Gemmatimonadota bacterium]|jgi:DNA repair protein RecO (recombination protein O)
MGVVTTRGTLLRSHPFSETSRILRFFTEDLGIVGVLARGIRSSGSKGRGVPDTFAGGTLTLYVKESRDLQTFKEFATTRARRALGRSVLRFAAASVLGEVVLRQGGEAAAPGLYDALDGGLDRIADLEDDDALVPVLLARGWGLVSTLGYHPVLETCVACGRTLAHDEMGRFDLGAGGMRCSDCSADTRGPRIGPGARDQIAGALAGREDPPTRPRAHLRLLSDFVTYHLCGGRPLESFRFLAGILPAAPSGRSKGGTADGAGERAAEDDDAFDDDGVREGQAAPGGEP